ncbi:methylated-DNA--[protein]-cysteine S-methyltransferase [Streptococcus henryi]|uniref:methylated-DNA--[protein]-cysteine S-methyltransferase n=1 Tax=Streptococcus henryi TaxID=439219 RepID=UPI00039DB61B|nr:methylated-DNA--[protein]-cysteine S-methyltransferase [Streptococcus henryi]
MLRKQNYNSPLGDMILIVDESGLYGAWFMGQKYDRLGFEDLEIAEQSSSILSEAQAWLDAYFAGQEPDFCPPLSPQGSPFQQRVWQELVKIPAGSTVTYGQLAELLGCKSAQAVGGAVGKNPLSIFIPCHRVLGSQGQLTGYAGGLERKVWLLEHEGLSLDDKSRVVLRKKND